MTQELQVRVFDIWGHSVDQVLVAGDTSGYRVYNTFDTGSINNDADIDPNQTATDLMAFDGKNVDESDTIVCVSDHEDSGQNEPYIQDGLPGEVAAKNRPIIQPIVAALGVSAVEGLNTYKVGFGYEHRALVRAAHDHGQPAVHAGTDRPDGLRGRRGRPEHARVRPDPCRAGRRPASQRHGRLRRGLRRPAQRAGRSRPARRVPPQRRRAGLPAQLAEPGRLGPRPVRVC